jgi:hypothetical protein
MWPLRDVDVVLVHETTILRYDSYIRQVDRQLQGLFTIDQLTHFVSVGQCI